MDQQQQAPAEDISPKTILVLVVLTLVVSFIGAWVNLQSAMEAPTPPVQQEASTAEVNFYIIGKEPPRTQAATGLVAFEIQ